MPLPSPQSIRNRIQQTYERGYVLGEDEVRYSIAPMSVASWRGEFVRGLCLAEKATSSVEVGMAWGLSTLHIIEALLANGATGRAHVVIDPMQTMWFHNAALRALRESGVDELVEFHEAPSNLALPALVAAGRQFDFAFIDGDHRYEAAFMDLVFADRLVKPGGVIAIDDTWSHPVYMACKFLEIYFHYTPMAEQLKPPVDSFLPDRKHRGSRSTGFAAALPKMRAYRKPLKPEEHDAELDFSRYALADAYLPGPIADRHARRLASYGLHELSEGRRDEARRAFATAIRLHPTRLRNYARYVRTILPSSVARLLSGRAGRGEKALAAQDGNSSDTVYFRPE